MSELAPDWNVDYHKVVSAVGAGDLMAQVGAGDHDPYLPQLRRFEAGHRARGVVLEACDARLRQLREPAPEPKKKPTRRRARSKA